MAAPAKFLFDTDFTDPNALRARSTPADLARLIAEAEERGYRNGFEAGQREARMASTRRTAVAFEDISNTLSAIAAGFANIEGRMETEAVDVALAVAHKLCSELVAREPLTEIMALVSDCFRHLTSTPHIVVRINDALYEGAKDQIETLARQSGFESRLVMLAEPEIETGDCKIEWADGGVVLERAAIEARIAEMVARYIASRSAPIIKSGEDRT